MVEELLTLDDLAGVYKCTRRHVRDVITKTIGFPEPAPGSTMFRPRWLATEVRAFLHRKPSSSRINPEFEEIPL